MSKAIYKLHYDCGRQGELNGVFVAEKAKMQWLKETRQEIYFGEVLGKHSEVSGPLDDVDFTLVSENEEAIKLVNDLDLQTGFNPLERSFTDQDWYAEQLGSKHEYYLTISEVYDLLHS